MNATVIDLIRMSNLAGADSDWVQGGGGNTSAKEPDGRVMYVKASGTALKDMDERRGWRKLDRDRLLAFLDDGSLAGLPAKEREDEVTRRLDQCCLDKGTARPSVESMLHAAMDRFVIHLHPFAVSAFVNARGGKGLLERLLAGLDRPFLWIPYCDPGYTLARRTVDLIRDYERRHGRKPQVLLLEKHGVFVCAPAADRALEITARVIAACRKRLPPIKVKKAPAPAPEAVRSWRLLLRRAVFEAAGNRVAVRHLWNDHIAAFASRPDAGRLLARPMSPDELVYAGGGALLLGPKDKDAAKMAARLRAYAGAGRKTPQVFLVPGVGLFSAGSPRDARVAEVIAAGALDVRVWAAGLGGFLPLTPKEESFIANWEAEQYRKILFSGAAAAELLGRVAVVTGAGSGLGRSIALGLARAGAQVAVFDIDVPAAEETVALVRSELPGALAQAVACNVTKEDDVARAFDAVLAGFGGLDILVNAAGVAPAHPLVDLPLDKWRLALEINLTGYFLMAREAARVMTAQGMGGSIVNISSKSGLDASRNNTPYNATKAGELHMARGWAMELGAQGIRVNCVCPGNVFEGSKIWNPAYIKECARKYGIRPEEVIPFYVDKTVLKREIKGQDIADAVVFLCSERARVITGQVVVADSGQVFVR